jgi:ABC-type nitrate/sulfonate/bicarbonate transport system ATPase subunit
MQSNPASPSAIAFQNVSYDVKTIRQQAFTVLKDVTFQINQGEFVCVVGPSGCGKTSTLNLIAGFMKPTEGNLTIEGEGGRAVQPAVCFQSDTSFGWMSCRENYRFALKHKKHKSERSDSDQIDEIAQLTGLTKFLDFYPKELSGGMRKRLELGRAWLTGSPVLLLDEPLGQLDHMTRQSMQLTLQELWLENRRTVLMITHDNEEAIFLADRIFVMGGPPGHIISELSVPFPRPRQDDCRYSIEFQALRKTLQDKLEKLEHGET